MSKSLATKNVATMFLALAMVLGFTFAFATPAKADVISDLQAQIQALLAQISALQGSSSSMPSASCNTFTRNHQMNDSGGEVMWIQQFLNSHGAMVSASGAGSPGNESSFFGAKTKAAVAMWQAANGVSPAVGYWGPITRAKANSMCTGTPGVPGVPGVPVTGNGLKVMLASDNPTYAALVQGQAIAELMKLTFANPTAAPIVVTNLAFKRIGVSSDSTLANVYLFQGNTRITDSAGVSNTMFSYNASTGLFTLLPGATVTISVRSDIAGSTNGQQVGVQLTSVTSSGLLDSSVVLPITGSALLVSSASLATVDFNSTTLPSSSSVNPQNDYVLWQNTITVGTRAVNLTSFQLRNLGSVDETDIRNLRLFVDGVQVGSAVANMSSGEASVSWDLSAAPKRLETGGRVVKVVGDIVAGSGDTFQFSLRRAADARVIDTELNQPVLATSAGSSFSARTATSATVGSASVSVVKANNSPTSNVMLGGSNVKWASFELRASGEDVKIESLDVQANTKDTATLNTARGLDNGKVFVDGVQVGSTKDLTDATDVNFTFGSSFIAKAGQVHIIDIYADAKSTTGAAFRANETAAITLGQGSSNAFGQVSLTAVNVPGSDTTGNTLTIASTTLTATKYSGYGNQTIIAGTSNARLGAFTLSSGSTEGANVNTIVITLSADEAATITDLRLVDATTGVQIGSSKPSPASGDNSFSVNFDIPVSSTKTINVIGNIKSGSNVGPWIAEVDTTSGGTGLTTGNSVTVGGDVTLQTITVGTGTFTQSTGTSPDNANVIAGSNDVKVGSFNFTAANSSFTLQDILVKIPANAATSVSSVTLKWAGGPAGGISQALALSSVAQESSTATFTGLTFAIPANETKVLDVYVNIPTIQNGASSGRAITAALDWNNGYKVVDSAGTASTTMALSTDLVATSSGKGTMYVRKSKPVLAAVALDSSTLTEGSNQVLARFSVTADAAGKIDWGQVVITLNKTAALTVGATTTLAIWSGANQITGTIATTTSATNGTGTADACSGVTSCLIHFRPTTVETIEAGTTKTYELRGTVGGVATGPNSISASIANVQTTASSTNVFDAAAGAPFGVSTESSFAWSDWSDLSDHSSSATGASTSDWTGDFLVRTLPLTVGNRSVNF